MRDELLTAVVLNFVQFLHENPKAESFVRETAARMIPLTDARPAIKMWHLSIKVGGIQIIKPAQQLTSQKCEKQCYPVKVGVCR